jgi:hypothetical protein
MSNASAEPASGSRSKTADFVTWAARNLAPGVIAGFVAGLVVGGAGSRLAMRILALTSDEFVRGAGTEAGATIGEITLEGTLFLLVAGSILGILGGILYTALRSLVPGSGAMRGLLFGLLLLALTGRFLVDPNNPDFVILSPAPLAVAMFAALPVLYGLMMVPLAERLDIKVRATGHLAFVLVPVVVALIPLMAVGLSGLLVVLACLVVWLARGLITPKFERAIALGSRLLIAAAALLMGAMFVRGVLEILGR